MERLINKAYAYTEVTVSAGVSGTLVSTPLWVTSLTEGLQILTLIVGIIVGISAIRLNEARRVKLEEEEDE